MLFLFHFRSESHTCLEHEKLVAAYHRNMRRTLKFKPEVVKRVNALYEDVARKVGRPRRNIFFVGIHNRRTDHIEWTRKRHKQEPLTPEFFYDAMDSYREDADEDNVVFLYISDDMEWGRKNIKNKHGDLYFVGNGITDVDEDIATDLATMAAANATVITRGTFSMWCALLNGNEYYTEYGMVVPDHVMNPDLYPEGAEYYL